MHILVHTILKFTAGFKPQLFFVLVWQHAVCHRLQLSCKIFTKVTSSVQLRQQLVYFYSQELPTSANINERVPQ